MGISRLSRIARLFRLGLFSSVPGSVSHVGVMG